VRARARVEVLGREEGAKAFALEPDAFEGLLERGRARARRTEGTARWKRSLSTSDARRVDGTAFEADVARVGARRRIERIASIARAREESVTRRGARKD